MGAIELGCGSDPLLTRDMYCELEPTWYMLVQAICAVRLNEPFEEHLPDNTRSRLVVEPLATPGPRVVRLSLVGPDQPARTAMTQADTFVAIGTREAHNFYSWAVATGLKTVGPSTLRYVKEYLSEAVDR